MENTKVALITGGTRGIGLGIAKSLQAEGYQLVLCGVREEHQLKALLEELNQKGTKVTYCQADISKREDRSRLVDFTYETFGKLNILVNNAGIAPSERRDILEASEESFEKLFKVNLQGPYFLTQSVANRMIKHQSQFPEEKMGIMNISSISAVVASVNRGDYCMTKAGVGMATQLWAARLGEYNIPVYEVRPGVIETDMTAKVKGKYDDLIKQGLLIEPRWGKPEDIGKAVAMLARGDLPYSTGQVLTLDGGLTSQRL